MRRIFSDWMERGDWWVVAPLAIWLLAVLVHGIYRMARQERIGSPYQIYRGLGPCWKWSFFAAVAWLLVSVAFLMITTPG